MCCSSYLSLVELQKKGHLLFIILNVQLLNGYVSVIASLNFNTKFPLQLLFVFPSTSFNSGGVGWRGWNCFIFIQIRPYIHMYGCTWLRIFNSNTNTNWLKFFTLVKLCVYSGKRMYTTIDKWVRMYVCTYVHPFMLTCKMICNCNCSVK